MARLPPLPTLQALEAAARHRSYSRAARELNLTHGAVSHQLRRLEADLGVVLFRRSGNDMLPTPEAEALAAALAEALDGVRRALDEVRRVSDDMPLVVSMETHFATRWFGPRLPALEAAGLSIELRVENRVADFVRDGVDAAVRLGVGPWPDVENTLILRETLFPVCSPELARRHRLSRPEDLFRAPLLRPAFGAWSDWFESQGLPAPETELLRVDDSAVLTDAAVRGVGVALGRRSLVQGQLADGALVRPVPGELDSGTGYHLVWRADSRRLGRIGALRDWLEAEVAAMA